LIRAEWETVLWWTMLLTGIGAAAISIVTNTLDRRGKNLLARHRRFWLHVASYGLLSASVLAFVLRGLLTPA
jgi:hypothetical protein